jgi:hypothetical protein
VPWRRAWASEAVGDPAARERADHAADQKEAGDKLLLEGGESSELLLEVEQGAGDDSRVVAEQQAAQCGRA